MQSILKTAVQTLGVLLIVTVLVFNTYYIAIATENFNNAISEVRDLVHEEKEDIELTITEAVKELPQPVESSLEVRGEPIQLIYRPDIAEKKRKVLQRLAPNNDTEFNGWWYRQENFWGFFEPDYFCTNEERIGTIGDGGKWVCGIRQLSHPCVIYSGGSRGESSFENEVFDVTGCEIHIFDPIGGFEDHLKKDHLFDDFRANKIFFHPWGIVAPQFDNGLEMKSIERIMKELNHTYVDVFKIDIEGHEWELLFHLFQQPDTPIPFGQMQIELHVMYPFPISSYSQLPQVAAFFDKIENHGFALFHREMNPWGLCCCELAWVNKHYMFKNSVYSPIDEDRQDTK